MNNNAILGIKLQSIQFVIQLPDDFTREGKRLGINEPASPP